MFCETVSSDLWTWISNILCANICGYRIFFGISIRNFNSVVIPWFFTSVCAWLFLPLVPIFRHLEKSTLSFTFPTPIAFGCRLLIPAIVRQLISYYPGDTGLPHSLFQSWNLQTQVSYWGMPLAWDRHSRVLNLCKSSN